MRLIFAALLLLGACSTSPVSTAYLPAASYRDYIYAGRYDQAIKMGAATDEAATIAYCAARVHLNGFSPEHIQKLDQFAAMPTPENRKEAEAIIRARNTRLGVRDFDAYVNEKCSLK